MKFPADNGVPMSVKYYGIVGENIVIMKVCGWPAAKW
jgi:hypothetical protein